ncbi:sulfurtransferase TusA family protein [Piscinibacter aquaticus]|uniref:Sulfurtransferase TusA family protein n=1 Tax=Piscinibacter aquaticus TaxID=392597 RepID=A0A5C6U1T0_9BURK|nr:sulfurtransferase TusA family protein [Piscinibacter aquaticus]
MDAQKEIDTRGLNCPLPILKAKKALADMKSGDVLKVVATDPGSVRDFQAFARQTGNELVEQSSANDEFTHFPAPTLSVGRRPQSSSDFRYSRNPGPSCGWASASSTLACRKPSLLPQS